MGCQAVSISHSCGPPALKLIWYTGLCLVGQGFLSWKTLQRLRVLERDPDPLRKQLMSPDVAHGSKLWGAVERMNLIGTQSRASIMPIMI